MNRFLYVLLQSTWGILQTLLGFILFVIHARRRHYFYHGACVTVWKNPSSVSLGLFVFITEEPYFYEKLKGEYTKEELSSRLLVHEYGHAVQSLILGPLYLPVMGIPSTLWGFLPYCAKLRREKPRSYFDFFTESWANGLGEFATKQPSMEFLFID